ncbi:hypothetical protein YC2023_044967 [Brassica napus]
MGKGEKNGDEEMNKSKEKPWEVERNVFRGRVDSFMPACILCKEIDVFLHGRDQWLIQSSEFSLHRMSQITFQGIYFKRMSMSKRVPKHRK